MPGFPDRRRRVALAGAISQPDDDAATIKARLDGDGEASRRMLHVSYSRWSYERRADGWRGPATANVAEDKMYEMKALVPERLALSDDAAVALAATLVSDSLGVMRLEGAAQGLGRAWVTSERLAFDSALLASLIARPAYAKPPKHHTSLISLI